jgi:hypothetical protein
MRSRTNSTTGNSQFITRRMIKITDQLRIIELDFFRFKTNSEYLEVFALDNALHRMDSEYFG